MGVLIRDEINRRLQKGELLRKPRRGEDGQFAIEADSYDLTAGVAIWKEPARGGNEEYVKDIFYKPGLPKGEQDKVTVLPGQMIFVITREDILMPPNLCGSVYSRNKLALDGILALNAGHVDPGYEGPIVIRLINYSKIPWTLTLGDAIFTIVFQTLDVGPCDNLEGHQTFSADEMLSRVRRTADAALSNALYDLYASDIDKKLSEHRIDALNEFRREMDERWVRREQIWSVLFSSLLSKVAGALIFLSIIAAAVFGGLIVFGVEF